MWHKNNGNLYIVFYESGFMYFSLEYTDYKDETLTDLKLFGQN